MPSRLLIPAEVQAGRLLLRQWRESDLDVFAEMMADPPSPATSPETLDFMGAPILVFDYPPPATPAARRVD